MALDGRDRLLWEKRREALREKLMQAPKTAGAVGLGLMKQLAQPTQLGYKTEGSMLKAQCKRLAGRAHVIGNTVFRFDEKGICRLVDQGYNGADFDLLCKQNGVVRLDPDTEQPMGLEVGPPPTPAELAERVEGKKVQADEAVAAVEQAKLVADADWEAGPPDLIVPAAEEPVVVEDTKKASRRKPAKE